jgi:release factor glutamine methyltransferase
VRVIPGLRADSSVEETVRLMARAFKAAGVESPETDARLLLGHALRLDRARLLAQHDRLLEAREVDAVSGLAARRLKREPVARILGHKEFWSLPLVITPDVLVPRPETETVVEAAVDAIARGAGGKTKRLRVLDIGTGTGALLLALLKELPAAEGVATDVSAAAIEVARENAERNGLAARCQFIVCNVAAGVGGIFDLVVSNPPYVARADIATLAPEVRDFDPALALDGGNDGLDAYRSLAGELPRLLRPGGLAVVELGAGQEAAVAALFADAGLHVAGTRKDLAGIPRALVASAAMS